MKYVYSFDEGNKDMRDILGGKGANLAEMTNLKLPVPKGFTVTTIACLKYYDDGMILDESIKDEIKNHIKNLENLTGCVFGSLDNPLLVSVRSGAKISMPGMMDTILNLGLNEKIVSSLIKKGFDERFVYDCYRRFIQMYSDVVMNLPKESFEGLFDKIKEDKNILYDTDLTSDDLKYVIQRYKEEYKKLTNSDFPSDCYEQLFKSVEAVFKSFNNERAITYRRLNDIPQNIGTAVNIQQMVYGNKNENSGTGVAFTRNPSNGDKNLFGEYLINAQGEDVVAGIRTPKDISTLKEIMPSIYDEFSKISNILENHYRDMQDMEFTIDDGKLYILQTRNGKRTASSAIKIAVDMVHEGLISKEEAVLRVDANSVSQLLHDTFDEEELKNKESIAKGLAASPGAGAGSIYFNAHDLIKAKNDGVKDLILVRSETSPEDILGMNSANGILTLRGGYTSHAAVVARGMGKCCVSGCDTLTIDEELKIMKDSFGNIYHEGDSISLDGTTGLVYKGIIKTKGAKLSTYFKEFMSYADSFRDMEVRCNADTVNDASFANMFNITGIGLCRTEHMFFKEDRILKFRKMILSVNDKEREEALNEILPYQENDFYDLFKEMNNKVVTIRLLDPPLHEFLPKKEEELEVLANDLNISITDVKDRVSKLKEFNPMMGHRGCRLDVTFPSIAKMQTRAIITSFIKAYKEGIKVKLEIMVPLIFSSNELKYVRNIIDNEAKSIMKEENVNLPYFVGCMIELPRAVLTSDEIAKYADFFSFGTNDLTQMTYGFSRDDASKFLDAYYEKNILDFDPFKTIDEEGVGQFIYLSKCKGLKTNSNLEFGVCGEHAGNPKSAKFFRKLGLNYVSVSPYRIPCAIIALAQASISIKNGN